MFFSLEAHRFEAEAGALQSVVQEYDDPDLELALPPGSPPQWLRSGSGHRRGQASSRRFSCA